MEIQSFDSFIFRCPLFPVNDKGSESLKELEQEAIFLASPDLFTETLRTDKKSQKKNIKKDLSLLKYQIRMRSRSTPFGLFAGCGIGQIGNKSEIVLGGPEAYKSHTRLDMQFLCALIQIMDSEKEQLFYYPNSSLYRILNSYRYVEYHYAEGRRKHDLSEIESDIYLEKVMEACEKGCHYSGILEILNKEEDLDKESIKEYVDSLIESQVIVNNLQPTVTGDDLFVTIIRAMDKANLSPEIKDILERITGQLRHIDELNPGRSLKLYDQIENDVKLLNVEYDRKYLFQTDTYVQPLSPTLSMDIIDIVKESIEALSKLAPRMENPLLANFVKEFYKRYEEEEVPLVEALDPDLGIGFGDLTPGRNDFHPLVDHIEGKQEIPLTMEFSETELLLLKKYQSCMDSGGFSITIEEKDLQDLSFDPTELPPTFSAAIEVIDPQPKAGNPAIIIKAIGGSSAANLINRFCHIDPKIRNFAADIVQREEEIIGEEKIVAEIVHLPESRVGNILFRPALHRYEIPYLAKESVGEEFKIPITDLLLSVKGGKTIRLRSKRLNKEIIPRLTNAHNFSANSLPIYYFLCSLQVNELKGGVPFSWGAYLSMKKFLPRVVYKKAILSLAKWNFKKEDLSNIPDVNNRDFISAAALFKKKNNLPDTVSLADSDNKLLIDFRKEESVKLLFAEVRNEDFILEEFIDYSATSLIKSGNSSYRNEIILGFYKTKTSDGG